MQRHPLPPARQRVPAPPALTPEQHAEQALDEALRESFPASDPVAVDVVPRRIPPTPAGVP